MSSQSRDSRLAAASRDAARRSSGSCRQSPPHQYGPDARSLCARSMLAGSIMPFANARQDRIYRTLDYLRGAPLRWSGSIEKGCEQAVWESLSRGHISSVSDIAASRGLLSWSLEIQDRHLRSCSRRAATPAIAFMLQESAAVCASSLGSLAGLRVQQDCVATSTSLRPASEAASSSSSPSGIAPSASNAATSPVATCCRKSETPERRRPGLAAAACSRCWSSQLKQACKWF